MTFRIDTRDGFTALAAAQRAGYRALFVITTNLGCRRDGTAIMGAGLAKAAAQRAVGIDARYGESLRSGRSVIVDGDFVLFPTKRDWRERSSLELIEQSAKALVDIVRGGGYDFVLVPRVGCNLGRLNWQQQVRPLLERVLAPIAERVIFVRQRFARGWNTAVPMQMQITWDPREDGVTHINVYSKGETTLGRALSNFAHAPFECEDGWFASVEAYWYWLGTNHARREELRGTYGFAAKRLGRELRAKDWQSGEEFKRKIRAAIRAKLLANRELLAQLRACALPLAHYYVFGGVVREPSDGKWVLEYLDEVRAALRRRR